eukprot:4421355-Prorocentrum_lima.AAC.1
MEVQQRQRLVSMTPRSIKDAAKGKRSATLPLQAATIPGDGSGDQFPEHFVGDSDSEREDPAAALAACCLWPTTMH